MAGRAYALKINRKYVTFSLCLIGYYLRQTYWGLVNGLRLTGQTSLMENLRMFVYISCRLIPIFRFYFL